MSLKLIVKDADFYADAISYTPAVTGGLEYLNFFGGSQASLGRNLAPGKPAASVVGSPVVNTSNAVFSYLERLVKTGVVQTSDATVIMVAKFPAGASGIWRQIISNFGRDNGTGGLKYGLSLSFKLDAADVRGVLGLVPVTTGSASSLTSNRPAVAGNTIFASARVDSVARSLTIDNKTTGTTLTTSYAATLKPELNGEFYIGSAAGLRADSAGDVEVSFAAIYNRPLSDAENSVMYQSVKAIYAGRGMSI